MGKDKYVIMDTDMENEIDDKFALVYALKSQEISVNSITIAPFSGSVYTKTDTIQEGNEMSFATTKNILEMCGVQLPVYQGSNVYFNAYAGEIPDASKEMIDACEKHEEVVILGLGALTNVAIAIKEKPEIAEKMEVLWLATNIIDFGCNDDFNLIQDVEAARFVFEHVRALSLIPGRGVASALLTSVYEFEHYTKDTNEINAYLYNEMKTKVVDYVGRNKVLWDLAVIAFYLNETQSLDWCRYKWMKRPRFQDDCGYGTETYPKEMKYVYYIERNFVYRDFYTKLMK